MGGIYIRRRFRACQAGISAKQFMGSVHRSLGFTEGSLYNAYADDLLDLQLLPDRVRDVQDLWYYSKIGYNYYEFTERYREVWSSIGLTAYVHKERLGNVYCRNL